MEAGHVLACSGRDPSVVWHDWRSGVRWQGGGALSAEADSQPANVHIKKGPESLRELEFLMKAVMDNGWILSLGWCHSFKICLQS